MKKTVFISGGGTGGHIYPAISIASIVDEIGVDEIIYIGNKNKMENRILADYPYRFFSIPIIGMPRKINLSIITFLLSLVISIFKLIPLFIKNKPKIVIGTGGFVTFPPLVVGKLFRAKIIIQEQNTYPGIVNKVVGKFANKILLGFSDASKFFSSNKCEVVGNPIKKIIPKISNTEMVLKPFLNVDTANIIPEIKSRFNKSILIFGGSLGASKINNLVNDFIKNFSLYIIENNILIIWITGRNEQFEIEKELHKNVITLAYTNDMDMIYSFCDIAISRSGAMTVFELYQNRIPALLIPFPYATANHQYYNALFLKNLGVANIITEDKLNRTIFDQNLIDTIENRDLKNNYQSCSKINPEEKIKNILTEIL